ncbi:MAG: DCC1-like thiol-disulfide oxidoreductase family protein [Candidatus Omnitrophica bacterium]|nr:DCC1-like thiol-disulfide oxidoreductase family protein [Candidatus Omnitrophota bacterium]
MSFRSFLKAWNDFWFAPQSPTPIALYRILAGLCVLASGVTFGRDLLLWFGNRGVLSHKTALQIYPPPHINLIAFFPPQDGFVIAFYVFFMIAAFTLTIGLFTRASSIIVYAGLLSFFHRNLILWDGGDFLLYMGLFFLMFSEAGAAMSVDRLWQIMRGKETGPPPAKSPWAQRLIQFQMAMLYFVTTNNKLAVDIWSNGTAIFYTSRIEKIQRFTVPYVFEHLWSLKFMTYATLVIEGALGTLVWFYECRYIVLAFGVLLHLGIEWTMNVSVFSWVMLSTYATFIEPQHLRLVMDKIRAYVARRYGKPVPVFYDGSCEACVRTARLIGAVNILHRVTLVDFRSPQELEAQAGWGQEQAKRAESELLIRLSNEWWLGGFDAFRWMAWRLPLLWPIAPFLHLPGAIGLGRPVYAWIAKNRYRFLGVHCAGAACSAAGR